MYQNLRNVHKNFEFVKNQRYFTVLNHVYITRPKPKAENIKTVFGDRILL